MRRLTPTREQFCLDLICPAFRSPDCAVCRMQRLDGAFTAVDSDPVAAAQAHRRVAAADDGGDAELASHDCGMGERRADVSNDGGGAREDRGPADVGRRGDEDLAVAELACNLRSC